LYLWTILDWDSGLGKCYRQNDQYFPAVNRQENREKSEINDPMDPKAENENLPQFTYI
jgi:hypothetical protein